MGKNPSFVITAEHFEFLDNLRDSGETNMWGAGPYLVEEFGLEEEDASFVLTSWMNTYDGSSTPEERVALSKKEMLH